MLATLIAIAVASASSAPTAAPAGSGSQAEPPMSQAGRAGEVPKAQAEAFIAQCGARKFETEVISDNQGKVRKAKILLCAKPGESDAQWIATLEKAARQIESSPALSAEAKSKATGEIQAAIALVRGGTGVHAQTGVGSGIRANQAFTLPRARAFPTDPLSRDPIVATVRPLPPPPSVAPRATAAIRAPVSKPPLTISCSQAGDLAGPGDCIELTSDTSLVIRADGDLNSGVLLRFVRDGDPRDDITLGKMRRKQIARFRLPPRVCAGVVRGRVKVQTIVFDPHSKAEQVAATLGPFLLRC